MLREDHPHNWRLAVSDYWALTKPEVNFLVLASTLAGFYVGARGSWSALRLVNTLLGTLLVASGTATLNQFLEWKYDARMRRTANRPLPAGRLAPACALWFGILLSGAGALDLALAVNALSSFLALFTLGSYLLFYTPLKRKTPLCTLVGAFPGAMPPLIGWAAARGSLDLEAWILYAVVFLWQFPHFLGIAWMYREDYARAGYVMLPPKDVEGRFTGREVFAFTLALLAVSLIPAFLRQAGVVYFFGASLLGLAFAACGARLAYSRSNALAKRLVLASIVYLPLLLALMMVDKASV